MSTELLPCPFCGAQPEPQSWQWLESRPAHYSMFCPECRCEISVYDSPEKAADAWNTRYDFNTEQSARDLLRRLAR